METRLSSNEISEHNKKALQSETGQKVRQAMKTEVQHFTDAPEIQHFAKMIMFMVLHGGIWSGNI